MKNYHKILGVSPDASIAEIKKAYRRLAMDNHPDRNSDNAASTKRFIEATEAYDALIQGTPSSTSTNGSAFNFTAKDFEQRFGPKWWENVDLDAFFNEVVDKKRNRRNNVASIMVSLREAYLGTVKTVEGRDVSIPRGVRDKTTIGFSDGSIVKILIPMDSIFERNLDNLLCDVTITAFEAMVGASAIISHLDGKRYKFYIPAGTQHGQIIKLDGKGMPNPEVDQRYGDLLVRCRIEIPTKLSESEKDMISSIMHKREIRVGD